MFQLEPENLDVMFKMGMLYLRNNSEDPAFAMFGKALSYDSTHQQVRPTRSCSEAEFESERFRAFSPPAPLCNRMETTTWPSTSTGTYSEFLLHLKLNSVRQSFQRKYLD